MRKYGKKHKVTFSEQVSVTLIKEYIITRAKFKASMQVSKL